MNRSKKAIRQGIRMLQFLMMIAVFLTLAIACQEDKFDKTDISFETIKIVEITPISAQLQTSWSSNKQLSALKQGFCYSTEENPVITDLLILGSEDKNISVTINDLAENTTYYAKAFVMISQNMIAYSPQIQLTTGRKPNTSDVHFDTVSVSEITDCSALLHISWHSELEIPSFKQGICYGTTINPNIQSDTIMVTGEKEFTIRIENLTENTPYYSRGFVIISDTLVAYSSEVQFTTPHDMRPLESYQAPKYADYYIAIADWDKRHQWNLSNVHDPTVILAEDGYYYMYQTDASYGNAHTPGGHFHGRRSKDLVNWEYLGGTMSTLPQWVIPKLNEIRSAMSLKPTTANAADFGYWAPCVRKVKNGLYRMYYSIVSPGLINGEGTWSERAFIGMMENSNPANNNEWIDKGYVITNASDKGLNFNIQANNWANCYFKWNAIDPTYIITPEGTHWLIYGSWHSGFASVELDPETGMPKKELGLPWASTAAPSEFGKQIATRLKNNRWQASEGPETVYRNGYYYMFMAYDELSIAYNTRVVRSRNINGPYLGIDGRNITLNGGEAFPIVTHPYKFTNSDGWVGISHCAIFDDGNDNWFYASQGRLPEGVNGNKYSNANMLGQIRSIRWTKTDWPLVMPQRYGNVPQIPIREKELIGNWEHIDLAYSYQQQIKPTTITIGTDHTVTQGVWSGKKWNFDAENQILTINGVDLYLQRECDWEASPRTHTIVYAGYSNNKTYWGKKSK